MNNRFPVITALFLTFASLTNSCLKPEDCISDVFENEDLYMDVYVDDQHRYIADSVKHQIFTGLRYQVDTIREDTIMLYFDCHFLFENGGEAISLTVLEYADFSEVIDMGYGNFNYSKFDSLIYRGDYEYVDRVGEIVDHGIKVRYLLGDSLQYFVDQSPGHPEDFYFNVDDFVKKNETDCYNRNFTWFTFTGTFGCRLVEAEIEDTIVIRDGEFRAVIAQFHYGIY